MLCEKCCKENETDPVCIDCFEELPYSDWKDNFNSGRCEDCFVKEFGKMGFSSFDPAIMPKITREEYWSQQNEMRDYYNLSKDDCKRWLAAQSPRRRAWIRWRVRDKSFLECLFLNLIYVGSIGLCFSELGPEHWASGPLVFIGIFLAWPILAMEFLDSRPLDCYVKGIMKW